MYLSPIVYPISIVPDNIRIFLIINPMTAPVQGFRFILDKNSIPSTEMVIYSISFGIILFLIGLVLFFKTEKKFIDTV